MAHKSQPKIILEYLKDLNDWQYEYKIRSLPTRYGFIGARGDRDVRDLIRGKIVDSKMEGKYRMVKYKAPKSTQNITESTQRSQQVLFVK